MNEYLEQLVRDLTNAYSRSQRMFGERVSPGPKSAKLSWSSLLLGAIANKTHPLIHLSFYALSHPHQRFFTHSLLDVLREGQGTTPNAAALSLCIQHIRQTSEPKSSLILTGGPSLWPFCSSVQGSYSRIRCSNVCVTARFPRMLQKL